MKTVVFCHSLVSDWNSGHAHFIRGVVSELIARGVDVIVYEPKDSWNAINLLEEYGQGALEGFKEAYPDLVSRSYDPATIDLNKALSGADAVLVHEWNNLDLIRRIGEHHKTKGHYVLLFHDSHHRSAEELEDAGKYDLRNYDGVLAFGNVVRDLYLNNGWIDQAWTWHEAADTRLFHPIVSHKEGDLVWFGNWSDDERAIEIREFLIEPVKQLGIRAKVFGTNYPTEAVRELERAGIEFGGWLPDYRVPEVFAKYRMTIHIPRRAYVRALPGIPTVRMYEALACAIPLISTPWRDTERLFTKADFLGARNGEEMEAQISWVLHHEAAAREIASHGRRTVLESHTCSHRADEFLQIVDNAQRDLIVRRESA
ncbi:MAG TPA: glycosyltransferase [Fimbriimonadaceae bacterium]|jgi:spore maturation protein CgeB